MSSGNALRSLFAPLLAASFALAGCGRSEEPFLLPPPAPYDVPGRAPAAGGAVAQPAEVRAVPTPAPTPTPAPGNNAAGPSEIRASHILIMHRDSMRVPPGITRTKDEARTRAQDVLRRVRAGGDFAALAREFSDEPGHESSAGDLNRFGRGAMVAPFEQAAFALQVNQVSDLVETPFGYHIIRRTE